ncbi:MAG: DUF420 domain-containing protein, partial [candidate division Zixibacteria bacterium]|nr:DUF420 domain-containing protein [candidate division Zixibacteria bacterium]
MNVPIQPTINALFNLTSAILLALGYVQIKSGRADRHKRLMIAALVSSCCFLIGYLVYHAAVGSVPYSRHDWTRPVYF